MKNFYIEKTSIIHNLNFWTKFICLLLLMPVSAFLAPPKLLLVIVFPFIVLSFISKIELKKFWNATKLYNVSIVIGMTLLTLIFSHGTLLNRLIEGLVLSIRFIILICFGVLFAMITNPIEIPTGMLKVKIPHKYGITVMIAFRMLPLISQKIKNIIDAQRARGAKLKLNIRTLPELIPRFISLMVPILHSTLNISVEISDTLISRGYNPDGRITIIPSKFKTGDYALFLFSGALLVWISIGF